MNDFSDEASRLEQIRKPVRRYFSLLDNGRSADLQSGCFTSDGKLMIDGADIFKGEVPNLGFPADPIVGYTHCLHQHDIVLDGERAFGEVYCTAYVMVEGGGGRRMLVRSIRYFDHYRPVGDEWRIALRHHHVHWMYEAPLTIARSGAERDGFAQFLNAFETERG